MIKKYQNITELIKDNLHFKEPLNWQSFFDKISKAKEKGYLTKDEFVEICNWKSSRPKRHYLKNSEEVIKEISKKVLASNSEDEKIELLTSLKGVGIPVASAILTLLNPENYGVIDIRVWQLLYNYGEVNTNPKGQTLTIDNWKTFLILLRKYATQFNMKVRDIELILFFHHREAQEGNLYSV